TNGTGSRVPGRAQCITDLLNYVPPLIKSKPNEAIRFGVQSFTGTDHFEPGRQRIRDRARSSGSYPRARSCHLARNRRRCRDRLIWTPPFTRLDPGTVWAIDDVRNGIVQGLIQHQALQEGEALVERGCIAGVVK